MCKGALYDARIEYHHKLLSLSAVTRALCVGRLERLERLIFSSGISLGFTRGYCASSTTIFAARQLHIRNPGRSRPLEEPAHDARLCLHLVAPPMGPASYRGGSAPAPRRCLCRPRPRE